MPNSQAKRHSAYRTSLAAVRLTNFRAYRDSAWFPIAPITLLFGANSSGKSTFFSAISALRQSLWTGAPGLLTRGRAVDLGPIATIAHSSRPADDIEIAFFFRHPKAARSRNLGSAISEYVASSPQRLGGIGLRFNARKLRSQRDLSPATVPLVGIDVYAVDLDNPLVRYRLPQGNLVLSRDLGPSSNRLELASDNVDAEHPFWSWFASTHGGALVAALGRFQAAEPNELKGPAAWALPGSHDASLDLYAAVEKAATRSSEDGTAQTYMEHVGSSRIGTSPRAQINGTKKAGGVVERALAQVAAEANRHTWIATTSWVPDRWGNQPALAAHVLATRWPVDIPFIHAGRYLESIGRHAMHVVENVERVTATRPRAQRFYYAQPIETDTGDRTGQRLVEFASQDESSKHLEALLRRAGLPYQYEVTHWQGPEGEGGLFSIAVREEDSVARNLVDHGIGTAHLLPIALALLAPERQMLLLEEPESHLHARLQTVVGSIIAAGALEREAPIIVETHSEHILRRILRHVRGSSEPPVPPDEVSILYITRMGSVSRVHSLTLGQDGTLARSWPEAGAEDGFRELLD